MGSTCVHEKYISGFNETPEAYFNEFYEQGQSISNQYLHRLDDICQCIWDRIQFENEMIPSAESISTLEKSMLGVRLMETIRQKYWMNYDWITTKDILAI